MVQMQPDSHNVSPPRTPEETSSPAGKKQSRSLWIIILVFTVFVMAVFLTENKEDPTSWWETDYHAGIESAKRQRKPALLCFFKQGTRFSSDMWQDVYSRSDVKKYVIANFIPILIDVDKQPEIARRYDITYYPTHYVEYPNTNKLNGPFKGSFRLFEFIKKANKSTQEENLF